MSKADFHHLARFDNYISMLRDNPEATIIHPECGVHLIDNAARAR